MDFFQEEIHLWWIIVKIIHHKEIYLLGDPFIKGGPAFSLSRSDSPCAESVCWPEEDRQMCPHKMHVIFGRKYRPFYEG